ncbi:MAG: MarR family transcriptional regulator [Pleurocapsa minor GSE-CHR-MK-17-07R]|jgi:DNA-binding MarR family transcriptional regulator|nr:MarR family transcriptional regulator [Pleurocapsa minor GSE-CHR-MK 17-07R]
MTDADLNALAKLMIDVVPRIMRSMSGDVRDASAETTDTQMAVLYILGDRNLSLTSLAEYMSVSTAAMTKTITTMEERGWVTRLRSTVDKRQVSISVTPEGFRARQVLEEHVASQLVGILSRLDDTEQRLLMAGFQTLRSLFVPHEEGQRPTS